MVKTDTFNIYIYTRMLCMCVCGRVCSMSWYHMFVIIVVRDLINFVHLILITTDGVFDSLRA